MLRMPKKILKTEIQPLSTKAVGAVVFGIKYLFWGVLPVARQRRDLGANFLKHTPLDIRVVYTAHQISSKSNKPFPLIYILYLYFLTFIFRWCFKVFFSCHQMLWRHLIDISETLPSTLYCSQVHSSRDQGGPGHQISSKSDKPFPSSRGKRFSW